jgi:YVTN family beta-propeller protein
LASDGVVRPARCLQLSIRVLFIAVLFIFASLSAIPLRGAAAEQTVLAIPTQGYPLAIAVNPLTNMIYAADDLLAGGVLVINGSTDELAGFIPTGKLPLAVDINPMTDVLYVANYADSDVVVINGTTDTLIATIGEVRYPAALAVNPETDEIYVGGVADLSISVINGSTNTVIKSLPEDCGPVNHLAVDPITNRIYATTSYSGFGGSVFGCVLVIDGATDSVIQEVLLGRSANPEALAVDEQTNVVYVGDSVRPLVYVINGSTDTLNGEIGTGNEYITSMGIDPRTQNLYLSDPYSNTIGIINSATDAFIGTLLVPGADAGIAINTATGTVFMADLGDGAILVTQGCNSSCVSQTAVGGLGSAG